jgi:hypothetical protein
MLYSAVAALNFGGPKALALRTVSSNKRNSKSALRSQT